MAHREETAIVTDYGDLYRRRDNDVARQMEYAGLGTDCGVQGYTTLAQAERLIDLLALPPRARVLDLGCGCGWPGLHLARRCGTRVVGSDLPLEGLVRAARSAGEMGVGALASWVRASARALPFGERAFGAVVHADVLC